MRKPFLILALGVTLLACWWVGHMEPSDSPAPTPQRVRLPAKIAKDLSAHAPAVDALSTTALTITASDVQNEDGAPEVNLFAAWSAFTIEEVQNEPPAEPVNPFIYEGRLWQDDQWKVFLTDGQQQYVLQVKESFADGWQVHQLDQKKLVLRHGKDRFEINLDDGVTF